MRQLRCVILLLLMPLAGCQFLNPETNRPLYYSAGMAGYAGGFRLAYGRWPNNVNELEEFTCMHGRADKFGIHAMECDDVVNLPYRIEMQPEGRHLRMRFYDPSNQEKCSLRLLAPPTGTGMGNFPMIVIKTTVFACPGRDRDE